MGELIVQRLASLGYTVTESDSWLIGFCTDKVTGHIQAVCNLSTMPEGLLYVVVDMVCGEFLTALKQTGQLDERFSLEQAVSSVQAGDTNVSFDTSATAEARLDSLLTYLTVGREGELLCYRRLRW